MATLFAGLFLFEAAGRKHKEWEKRQTHTTKKVDIFYYGDGGSIVLSWDLAYLIVIGINNVMSTLQIYIYILYKPIKHLQHREHVFSIRETR